MTKPFDLVLVRQWAYEAGQLALRYYQTGLSSEPKSDNSPVTEADRRVEQYLVRQIQATYPGHGIIGEEFGGDVTNREFIWALDPIDGTRVFVAGLPIWAVALGLLRAGLPYRGLVYLPVLDEWYFTDEAGIAYWGQRPLAGLLQTTWQRDSFICAPSDTHKHFTGNLPRMHSLGAVTAHQCFVARGAAAAVLAKRPYVWDLAAPQAILNAIGAVSLHLDGTPLDAAAVLCQRQVQAPLLSGHPVMVERLLPRIKQRADNSKNFSKNE